MNSQSTSARRLGLLATLGVAAAGMAGCNRASQPAPDRPAVASIAGETYSVHDTIVVAAFDAAGVAAPIQQATLSTKLMGSVTDVVVREGDRVAEGQLLVRIDARDLVAKSAQVSASIADAEAMRREAQTQAARMRALFADSAATRAQLDAAETALARADAAVTAARAAASEIVALNSYSTISAPFAGTITKRFVDPGAFAAPGAPLLAIQDASTLRISVTATPAIARNVRRGQQVLATIETQPVNARIEGVVPAASGNLYTINALVPNLQGALLAGGTATLAIPTGTRSTLAVPATAIVRQGDLTGVTLRTAQGDERRWIRLGRASGGMIEVLAGLRAGDRVVLPTPQATARR